MANRLLSALILMSLLSTVSGAADGDLNGACLPGRTCTNTNLYACDRFSSTCKIRPNQLCTVSDNCVTGALCDVNKKCACNDSTAIDANTLSHCLTKLNFNCARNSSDCVPGASCPRAGSKCTCAGSYVSRNDSSGCLAYANNKCPVNNYCISGATCNGTNTPCRCSPELFPTPEGRRCLAPLNVSCVVVNWCIAGATCSGVKKPCLCNDGLITNGTTNCLAKADSLCPAIGSCIPGASCPGANKTCTCGPGLAASADKTRCLTKIGFNCPNSSADCVPGSTCTGPGTKCVCPPEVGASSTGTRCLPLKGSSCNVSEGCADSINLVCDPTDKVCKIRVRSILTCSANECVTGTTCTSGYCSCATGYNLDDACNTVEIASCSATSAGGCNSTDVCDPYNNTCRIKSDGVCTLGTIKCTSGSSCIPTESSFACGCDPLTTIADTTNGFCQKKIEAGAACSIFDKCGDANMVCDRQSSKCVLASSSLCNPSDTCVTGAICTGSVCTCQSGFVELDGFCVAPTGKPGGACTASRTCSDSNAECKTIIGYGGVITYSCSCKANYQVDPTDGTCKVPALGFLCSNDNPCSDPAYGCDPTNNFCKIRARQSCVANPNQCVTGAACVDGTCTCTAASNVDDLCRQETFTSCSPTSSGVCNATDVCDPYTNTCRIKSSGTCTSGTTKCTTGASCLQANANFICTCDAVTTVVEGTNGYCRKKVSTGGTCSAYDMCSDANTFCDSQLGKCALEAFTPCSPTSSGTCSGTEVCDPYTNACKIKATGTCTSGTTKCTTGASCSQAACTCDAATTVVEATKGYCQKTVSGGGACLVYDKCTDTNTTCDSRLGKCAKILMSTCASSDTCVAGAVCTNDVCTCAPGNVESNGRCEPETMTPCSQTSTGTCSSTEVCDPYTNTCRIKYSGNCPRGTLKCTSGATCTQAASAYACTCDAATTVEEATKGYCQKKVSGGGACLVYDKCTDTNTTCDSRLGKCAKVLMSPCTLSDICVAGAVCTNDVCSCAAGNVESNGRCEPETMTACSATSAGTCSDTEVCDPYTNTCRIKSSGNCTVGTLKCTSGATCTQAVSGYACTCDAENYVAETANGYCQKKITTGAACAWYDKCSDSNTVCDRQRGKCVKALKSVCTANDTCLTGGVCTSSMCTCATRFKESDGFCVAAPGKPGGPCSNGACSDFFSQCKALLKYGGAGVTNYFCYCLADFQIDSTDGTCRGAASSLSKTTGYIIVMTALYLGFHL